MKLCRTAAQILSAVQTTLSRYDVGKVTIVGHSLGGSLGMIDGIFLPLHIHNVTFRVAVFGCPRVCFIFISLDSVPIISGRQPRFR